MRPCHRLQSPAPRFIILNAKFIMFIQNSTFFNHLPCVHHLGLRHATRTSSGERLGDPQFDHQSADLGRLPVAVSRDGLFSYRNQLLFSIQSVTCSGGSSCFQQNNHGITTEASIEESPAKACRSPKWPLPSSVLLKSPVWYNSNSSNTRRSSRFGKLLRSSPRSISNVCLRQKLSFLM